MDMNAIKALANAAAERDDQTKLPPAFTREPIEEGACVARLIDYIELGMEAQEYKGEKKKPAMKLQLTFEICSPKHLRKSEDGEKQWFPTIRVNMPIKKNEKAKFTKLLIKMIAGRPGIAHMAQMLGECFSAKIVHNVVNEGQKNERTYENLATADGEWTIGAPMVENAMTGQMTKLSYLPEHEPFISECRIFLWDTPTMDTWNALHIEGEYEVNGENGEKVTKSKNFLQNTLRTSLTYTGSPLEDMLGGIADLPEAEVPVEADDDVTPVSDETSDDEPVSEANPPSATEEPEAPPEDEALANMQALGLA
jgi:hypothetical protein